jgi:predicted transcriptional regulator
MPDVPVSKMESAAAAHEDRRLRAVEDGRADIAAGRVLTPERIDDWIATLGTGYEKPLPQSTCVPC